MQQKIDYKGRTIYAETTKHDRGWTWAYQIDTGPWHRSSANATASEERVLKEAIREAQREIDGIGG